MNPIDILDNFLRVSPSRRMLEELISEKSREISGRVLEIGLGEYPHSDYFDEYITLDIMKSKRPDILADANVLPFRKSVFNGVVCIAVLEHVKRPRWVFEEIKRVLAPSGKVLIWVPFIQPMHDLPNDYFRFTREGIIDVLGDKSHVEIVPCGGFFSTIAYLCWGVVEYFRRKKSLLMFLPIPFYLFSLLFVGLDRYDKEKRISIGYFGVFQNLEEKSR